jgi:hypothetical protein
MKTATVGFTGILLVLGVIGVMGCAGYSLDNLIHVATPPAIQTQFSLPPTMPLKDAERESRIRFEVVKSSFGNWFQDIHASRSMVDGLESAIFAGVNSLIPALGPFAGIGGILTAYFLRKPGDVSPKKYAADVNKIKEDTHVATWDEATKAAADSFRSMLDGMGIKAPLPTLPDRRPATIGGPSPIG